MFGSIFMETMDLSDQKITFEGQGCLLLSLNMTYGTQGSLWGSIKKMVLFLYFLNKGGAVLVYLKFM